MLAEYWHACISLLLPAATHALLRVYVAQRLGESALGLFSLTWAVYSCALTFGTLGAGVGMTRYVARLRDATRWQYHVLSAGLTQALIGSLIAALSLAALARFIAIDLFGVGGLARLLPVAAIALPGAAAGKVVLGFLNGQCRIRALMLVTAAQSLASGACTVVLVESGYGATGVTAGILLPSALAGVAALVAVRQQGPVRLLPLPISPTLLHYGALVTLTNSVGLLQSYTDTVMIGALLSELEAGLYAAALLALQLVIFPGTAARLLVTPRVSALWGKGHTVPLQSLINRSLSATSMLTFPAAFVLALGSPFILPAVFGARFLAAAPAIAALMPGAAVMGAWAATGAVLGITGYVQTAFRLSLLSAAANVPLNAILIPHCGITGAALATSASLAGACLLEACAVRRRLGINFDWRRPAIAGATLAAIASWLWCTNGQPDSILGLALWCLAAMALCLLLQPARLRNELIAIIRTGLKHGTG